MILKTYPNRNLYGNYFLAVEAPDDEVVTEEQPKPKRNVKVITVKPSSRGKDFTQVGADDPITPDTTEVDDNIDVDDTDFAEDPTDTPNEPEQTPEDTTPEAQSDAEAENTDTDDAPDTGNAEEDFTDTDGVNQGDPTADEGETGEDAPDTDSGDDFTDGSDTTQPAGDDGNAAASTANAGKPNAPGVELDSTRKYNLYKEYMSLYNSCDNYISKLENILRNDFEENQIIRISVSNLRDIKDILFDYMTIRYQLNSYVQSLLFYQKMVVSVQLVFKLLKSINSGKSKK